MVNDLKIFAGTSNRPLAEKIAGHLGNKVSNCTLRRFSDGEIFFQIDENIRGMDTFIIQSTNPPAENLIELFIMIDACRRASARRITAVIPYYGYARQDRKDQPRVALAAKLVANIISTAGADRVLTMDLHSPSIQGFFDIPFDHLYGINIFMDFVVERIGEKPIVVAPDIGSSKRARAYANRMGTELALVDKKRITPNCVEEVTLIGDVADRNVLLVDDLIDTAGTLCAAVEKLKESGAREIFAACTHPLLSGKAVERIEQSQMSRLYVTDTILIPEEKCSKKIEVLPSAALFGEALKRIHNEESISTLFDY